MVVFIVEMDTNDFEERYNRDLELEHTKIGNILCYDEEEKIFAKADMDLFGNSSNIHTYDKLGKLSKGYRSNQAGNIEYRILEISNNMIMIEILSNKIKVNYSAYLSIKNHCDMINKDHNEEINKNAINIKQKIAAYLLDKELVLMLENFINDIPCDFYLNPTLIIEVEAYIVYSYTNAEYTLLLLSDEIKRATFCKIEELQKDECTFCEHITLKDGELIPSYFNNGMKLLAEIIQNRYNIDNSTSVYVAYILIYRITISKYASEWEKDFTGYFSEIGRISLTEAIDIYLSIETINHGNVQTAGKFIYYLMSNEKFETNDNYLVCFDKFVELYNVAEKQLKLNQFKKKLETPKENKAKYSIDDVDLMNGYEFENFVAEMFSKMGYSTTVTKSSGDQGIDVIAEKNGNKTGIQAKCYTNTVSNSAIQEVVAGIHYYNLSKAIVVTNNFFTNSAIELANANNVVLWDRNILKEKIGEIF